MQEDEKMEDEKMEDEKIDEISQDYKTGDEAKELEIVSEKEEIKEDVVMEEAEDPTPALIGKSNQFIFLAQNKQTYDIFKKNEGRLKIILDKFQALSKRLKKRLNLEKERKSAKSESGQDEYVLFFNL